MGDFIKLIIDYLKEVKQDWIVPYLFLLMIAIAAATGIIKALRWLQERRLKLHLRPFYDDREILDARKYYVETYCQGTAPSVLDEIAKSTTVRDRIIRFFLKEAFPPPGDDKKFYLILGGSGTGKTTFMINLCYRYLSKWWGKHYDIRLMPINHVETEKEIKRIIDAGKAHDTILLLDALDEDKAAADNFTERMNSLLESVQTFKDVIITCRTQFVPKEDAIPGQVRIERNGPRRGFHELAKFYISPFTHQDIEKFLSKKFGRWPFGKKRKSKQKARSIVQKAPNLMARPMLLGHIDLLLNDTSRSFDLIHEIYEVMIDAWLQREADRVFEGKEKFKQELLRFSQELAVRIYHQWREGGVLHFAMDDVLSFSSEYEIELGKVDLESKSLLNKDTAGNLKFAHKSILEYFIALKAKEDGKFLELLDFEGMDVALQFCEEMNVLPEMVLIKGGTFQMGNKEVYAEFPVHNVTVSDFYLGKYEVTQAQWRWIMGTNPSHFRDCDQCPVEQVSWDDIQGFIKKLNAKTGKTYRLPTEAEWEYAAGGGNGSRTKWAGTNNESSLGSYAWYSSNSGKKTHPVGQKQPNDLGLYDMSGNVWEWCGDWYGEDYYASSPSNNPKGPASGASRVLRGGSWLYAPVHCRVALRNSGGPSSRNNNLGFRLAR